MGRPVGKKILNERCICWWRTVHLLGTNIQYFYEFG